MQSQEFKNFSITRTTPGTLPFPQKFMEVKEMVLGKNYDLNLIFVDTKTATELHKKFKKLSDPANILSFPHAKNEGEILMHLGTIRTQAKNYDRSYHAHLVFMFIHGCLHLKGFKHGKAMEEMENTYMKMMEM